MVTGQPFRWGKLKDFLLKSMLYATLVSLNRTITSFFAEQNNTLIKRLVLERILFAEVDAFQKMSLPPNFVEKITLDINSTLDFINIYLPMLISSLAALLIDGIELYQKQVDPLALVYPVIAHSLQRLAGWLVYRFFKKGQKKETKRNNLEFDQHMIGAINNMVDIQANNLQATRLKAFDETGAKMALPKPFAVPMLIGLARELYNRHNFTEVFVRALETVRTMNLFGFVLEIWCVHKVMKRHGMTYPQYTKIQQEIEHVVILGRTVFRIMNRARRLLTEQSKVLHLLQMPTFLSEQPKHDLNLDLAPFTSLILSNLQYTHPSLSTPTIDLKHGILKFKPKVTYGIVGGDRVGTTLAHLICNITQPQHGCLTWNGIEYANIPRTNLRKMITYITDSSIICDGTIQDNLLLVQPNASEEDLMNAIKKSGLHHFLLVHGEGEQGASAAPLKNRKKKKTKDGIIPRTVSYGDIVTLVTPHGDVFQDSTSTHFPLTLPDDNQSVGFTEGHHSDSEEEISEPIDDSDKQPQEEDTKPHDSYSEHTHTDSNLQQDSSSDEEHASFFKSVSAPNLLSKTLRDSFEQNLKTSPDTPRKKHDSGPTEEELRTILNIPVLASTISRGLSQAIGLARLFLRPESKVVILNDALGSLDQLKLRRIVFPNLWNFVQANNVCLIVVSKNHSTIRDLDCILVFDPTRGTIVHAGTHKELLQQKAKLYIQFMFPWKVSPTAVQGKEEEMLGKAASEKNVSKLVITSTKNRPLPPGGKNL